MTLRSYTAATFLFLILASPGRLACAQPEEDSQSSQLEAIQNEYWEFRLREFPLLATSTGDSRYNNRLDSVSLSDCERRNNVYQMFSDRLAAINPDTLTSDERINRDILLRLLRDAIAEYRFKMYLIPINQRSGFHVEFPELRRDVPLQTTTDYENYISRLNEFKKYSEGHIALMREGMANEVVLPAVVMEGWQKAVDAQIVGSPEQSVLYEPFRKFPVGVPEPDHDRLRTAARAAISDSVVPGYRELRAFLADEYVPRCRDSISASALPDGRDFYRHRVRMFTTTDHSPDEVHQIGLNEVKRIRGEMEEVMAQVKFDGDFADFLKHLRSEPRFFVESPEELMKEVALVLKHMDGQLPALFERLPRMPYGIREVPDYVAPRTTAAYYQQPTGDGTKAGFYYVNTYNLKSRPLYNIEALSFHEAVPGHHLQLALQLELPSLPEFRRFSDFTSFVEGWALYAERLGLEVGFYEDPYSNFGRLTMEMWRACRLVVDTGMHYFGWSREQAIDFLADNTALSMHDIESEIDRYIAWPGQALAYKMGELKIRELRRKAEQQLGTDFDIREFHNVVLSAGGVPLDVLEKNVNRWLTEKLR